MRSMMLLIPVFVAALAGPIRGQETFILDRTHVEEMLYLSGAEAEPIVRELAMQLHAQYRETAHQLSAELKETLEKWPQPGNDERALARYWRERQQTSERYAQRQQELRGTLASDLAALTEAVHGAGLLCGYAERQASLSLSIGGAGKHVDLLRPWMLSGQPLSPGFREAYSEYITQLSLLLDSRDRHRAAANGEDGPRNPIYAAIRSDATAKGLHDEFAQRLLEQLSGDERVRFENVHLAHRHPTYYGGTEVDGLLLALSEQPAGWTDLLLECRARLHQANHACVEMDNRVLDGQLRLAGAGWTWDDMVVLKRHRDAARKDRERVLAELLAQLKEIAAPGP